MIREGKGENQRVVYIEEPTRSALKNWLGVHPDPLPTAPLFVTMRGGTQLAPRTVNGIISRWAKAADVPSHVSVSPHYWRRTFATTYAVEGGDVFSLQEIMGHANIETTRIYIAASQKWVQEQHRRHSPLNHLNLE